MYCIACGKKSPEGAAFCAWCGSKLPELAGQAESAITVEAASEPAPSPAEPESSGGDAGAKEPAPEQLDLDFDALSEEEPEPPKPNPAHRVFQRPQTVIPHANDALTVRPLAANPAQPLRGAEAAAVAAVASEPEEFPDEPEDDGPDLDDAPAPKGNKGSAGGDFDDDEWVRPESGRRDGPKPRFGLGGEKPAKRSLFGREDGRSAKRPAYEREDERPAKPSPYERDDERPAKRSPHEREDERPVKRSPYEREDERPAKRSPYERDDERPAKRASIGPDDGMLPKARGKSDRPRPETARGKAVTASGGMVTPPARRSPARPSGPFKPQNRKKDLFFEDLETPAENFYDEAAEERALSRRIKAIVSVALAVGVVMVAVWLMWTPGGQIVRAQLNLGAPAYAYKALGDQDLAGGQVQRAADAYYNALKLDPENYEYSMLVGKTQEMIGDRDTAAKAYMKCTMVKPTAVEPYIRLKELYRVLGDNDKAESWRAEGYAKTNDAALAPGT